MIPAIMDVFYEQALFRLCESKELATVNQMVFKAGTGRNSQTESKATVKNEAADIMKRQYKYEDGQ
ncbi:hypothetical protein [Allobaculum sp. JKK-2023]|uniref:hypothetical protein n=1 Tax=Allobaculum sp. JKK-2023 TaxID=3108943 RepID=UPI002B052C28|nr:hypothetical protein [Allobaculum sp. JKK-2023]